MKSAADTGRPAKKVCSMAQVPGGTYRAGDDSWAPASLSQGGGQIAHHM